MKTKYHDDPRLTALVLNELDEKERAALEAELADDPEAQAFIEELRETTNLLQDELAEEPITGLTDEQRERVLSSGDAVPPKRHRLLMFIIPAAAACIALAVGITALLRPDAYAPGAAESAPPTTEYLQKEEDQRQARERGGSAETPVPGEVFADKDAGADVNALEVDLEDLKVADQGANAPKNEWSDALHIDGHLEGGKPGTKEFATNGAAPAPPQAATPAREPKPAAKPEERTREPQAAASGRTEVATDYLALRVEPPPAPVRRNHATVDQDDRAKLGDSAATVPQANGQRLAEKKREEAPAMTAPAPRMEADEEARGLRAAPPADATPEVRARSEEWDREAYQQIVENEFKQVSDHPLSTFSIDVDTAAYANVRRYLTSNRLPPKDAVRIEELINYFPYDYPQPEGEHPFSVNLEVAQAPWQMQHRLVRIGLKGREVRHRPAANLVFLLDVSGSMNRQNKLPLVKESLKLLAGQLGNEDRVAIVVYAGASGLVLPSTAGSDIDAIVGALNRLSAGGSTNGGAGIQLAYQTAKEHFIEGGVNRVILATDGDFNVGTTHRGALVEMVQEYAKDDIFLTVLGFGMGNLNDHTLEQLANKGNGNYGYIDTLAEARKMMVEQVGGTLVTIAKDVKIQVEFNPAQVQAYRLIGYENRMLAKEDFNDDTKDAGEIGSGHTVTALYEVIPAGVETETEVAAVDDLRYQAREAAPAAAMADAEVPSSVANELLNVKLRYKAPTGDVSTKLEVPLVDEEQRYSEASADYKFAASVATFGMLLRDSATKGTANWELVLELAAEGVGDDPHGYRQGFLELVKKAKALSQR